MKINLCAVHRNNIKREYITELYVHFKIANCMLCEFHLNGKREYKHLEIGLSLEQKIKGSEVVNILKPFSILKKFTKTLHV